VTNVFELIEEFLTAQDGAPPPRTLPPYLLQGEDGINRLDGASDANTGGGPGGIV